MLTEGSPRAGQAQLLHAPLKLKAAQSKSAGGRHDVPTVRVESLSNRFFRKRFGLHDALGLRQSQPRLDAGCPFEHLTLAFVDGDQEQLFQLSQIGRVVMPREAAKE